MDNPKIILWESLVTRWISCYPKTFIKINVFLQLRRGLMRVWAATHPLRAPKAPYGRFRRFVQIGVRLRAAKPNLY